MPSPPISVMKRNERKQENRALTAEVALKEQSLVYTRIILGLSGCLLAAGVVYLICRRRRQLKEQEEHPPPTERVTDFTAGTEPA